MQTTGYILLGLALFIFGCLVPIMFLFYLGVIAYLMIDYGRWCKKNK